MIAPHIKEIMSGKNSSVIRKMFEEGIALKEKYGKENVFDFSLGNPDLEIPDSIYETIKSIAQDKTKDAHAYMPNAGYMETRNAMADKINLEQNLAGKNSLTGNHIVMSVGAAGALCSVFKTILSNEDQVIVPSPFFAEYKNYASHFGGVIIPVKCKQDFSLNIEGIKNSLNSKTAAVLINSPNNPSGKIYSEEEIKILSQCLKEHGEKSGRKPYLILDEPYRAITFNGKKVANAFQYYNESVVVTSFAKNLSIPGERIGFVAVNPNCEDALEFIQGVIFSTRTLGYVNAPAFFQKVVAKCWNTKVDYSAYEKRMNMITKIVKNAGIEFAEPEGAFYLFCKAPMPLKEENKKFILKNEQGEEFCDEFAFVDHLKKYNILCAPGTGFGYSGYYRMAYCVSEDTIKNCEQAMKNAKDSW
ncbi:MAG: pyridoxal phosphate-dependent aminotransferase [Treponemataceae bacterium]